MATSIRADFTQGNIPKSMLLFALPLMAANLLQVVYSMVDMMIVGQIVHSAWVYSAVCYGLFAVACLAFSRQIFGAFTSDAAVLDMSDLWIRASVLGFAGQAILRGAFGFIQGIGNVSLSFALSLLDSLIVRIALSFLLGTVLAMGAQGYYIGYLNAAYASAIPSLIYYLSGRWKSRKLVIGD